MISSGNPIEEEGRAILWDMVTSLPSTRPPLSLPGLSMSELSRARVMRSLKAGDKDTAADVARRYLVPEQCDEATVTKYRIGELQARLRHGDVLALEKEELEDVIRASEGKDSRVLNEEFGKVVERFEANGAPQTPLQLFRLPLDECTSDLGKLWAPSLMSTFSGSRSGALFDGSGVRAVTNYKWEKFGRARHTGELVFNLMLMVVVVVLAVISATRRSSSGEEGMMSGVDGGGWLAVLMYVMSARLICGELFQLFVFWYKLGYDKDQQVREEWEDRMDVVDLPLRTEIWFQLYRMSSLWRVLLTVKAYLSSMWNWIDVSRIVCSVWGTALLMNGSSSARDWLAMAVVCHGGKVFHFLLPYQATGPFVIMIIEVTTSSSSCFSSSSLLSPLTPWFVSW